MRTKTITISSCEDCPHYMFDYDGGDAKYFGESVCWFGRDPNSIDDKLAKPRCILKDASKIPANCPLP